MIIIADQILLYRKIHVLLLLIFFFFFVMLYSSFVMNILEKILGVATAPKSHISAHSSFFMGISYAKSVNSLTCLYTMHANVSLVAFAAIHGLSSLFLVISLAVCGRLHPSLVFISGFSA
jgi:hypothetical protein